MRKSTTIHHVGYIIFAALLVTSIGQAGVIDDSGGTIPLPAGDREMVVVAQQYFQRGDAVACMKSLKVACTNNPDLSAPEMLFIELLLSSGRDGQASAQLETLSATHNSDPTLFRIAGQIALMQQRRIDAVVHFENALAMLLASGLDQRGWTGKRQSSCVGRCHLGLATVAEMRGDWSQAIDHLRYAERAMPQNKRIRPQIARALFVDKQYMAAHVELGKLLDQPPLKTKAEAALAMAELAVATNRSNVADEWFQRAIDQQPDATTPLLKYVSWLLDSGRSADARQQLKVALKLEPESIAIRTAFADADRMDGNLIEAQAAYESLLAEQPNQIRWANSLAIVLVEQDNVAKQTRGLGLAMTNAQRLPANTEVMATLGRALFLSGQRQQATEVFRVVTSSGKATLDTAFFLAVLEEKAGQPTTSIKLLEESLRTRGRFFARKKAQSMLARLKSSGETPAESDNAKTKKSNA